MRSVLIISDLMDFVNIFNKKISKKQRILNTSQDYALRLSKNSAAAYAVKLILGDSFGNTAKRLQADN